MNLSPAVLTSRPFGTGRGGETDEEMMKVDVKMCLFRGAVCSDPVPPPYRELSRATVCRAPSIWHKVQSTQLPGSRGPERSVYFGDCPVPASDFRCVPFR
ncbi:unnamed protein product [Pleuronectes platessa]|uniref:Uncharacterized protein n=1 Tax=Pleuronectes platessa TaxID=8262 RepID=A0A9N7V9G5_PLEPL|nr:unnamed protein product [Pleuronectes platessa]